MAKTGKHHSCICERAHGLAAYDIANTLNMGRDRNVNDRAAIGEMGQGWLQIQNPLGKVVVQKFLNKGQCQLRHH